MSADLIQRLRTRNGRPDGFGLGPVCDEAATELERLTAELAAARAEVEGLRADAVNLADALEDAQSILKQEGLLVDAECAKRALSVFEKSRASIDAARQVG